MAACTAVFLTSVSACSRREDFRHLEAAAFLQLVDHLDDDVVGDFFLADLFLGIEHGLAAGLGSAAVLAVESFGRLRRRPVRPVFASWSSSSQPGPPIWS